MNLYRCVNDNCGVGGEFEADKPDCPHCKAPAIELVPVHYLVLDDDGPMKSPHGNRRVACMPARSRLPKAASGERAAVTCPKCKASAAFARHAAEGRDQHLPILEAKIEKEHGVKLIRD